MTFTSEIYTNMYECYNASSVVTRVQLFLLRSRLLCPLLDIFSLNLQVLDPFGRLSISADGAYILVNPTHE